MSKPRKRRSPRGRGEGFGKAESWAGRGQHAIGLTPNQSQRGDHVLPLTASSLLGGPKRYRVGMLLGDDGLALPGLLVVDNVLRRIVTLTMEQAEQWASNFAEESEATVIRGWVATWRAEQAGLRGCA